MKLRIAGLVNDSIVDGPGFRFTVFTQGCPHGCEGCHNPQTHNFNDGYIIDTDKILETIKNNPMLDGATFSGGEPFCQAKSLADLAYKIHNIKNQQLNIIIYTGYTYEYLLENSNDENHYLQLLKECDYLIDGKFILSQRSLDLKFRGSSNQRFIDVKKSLECGKTVILDDYTLSLM